MNVFVLGGGRDIIRECVCVGACGHVQACGCM